MDVESDMHSIGETARVSGLTVSALRFYDAAGVLVPAAVDPHTGYRWYAVSQLRAARLLAGLRRVGLPLAEITEAVRALPDVTVARRLLDVHLRRLQDGLADARRELSRIHALLDAEENRTTMTTTTTRVTVDAADLADALDAVRFAVGTDPEIPALAGVHVEVSAAAVRFAATDRYRMAVAGLVPTAVDGPAVTVLVPGGFVTGVRSQVDRNPVAELNFGPDGVDACARAGGSPPTRWTTTSPTTGRCCRSGAPRADDRSPWTPPSCDGRWHPTGPRRWYANTSASPTRSRCWRRPTTAPSNASTRRPGAPHRIGTSR